MATITRVLVPSDFSECSGRALDYAKTVADRFGASLDLLNVVPNPYVAAASEVNVPLPQEFLDELEGEARQQLEAALSPAERSRFHAQVSVQIGDPLLAITEYAKANAIDLIVMGTHGRTGLAHVVLGSVAERVVRTAPCPVLTVR